MWPGTGLWLETDLRSTRVSALLPLRPTLSHTFVGAESSARALPTQQAHEPTHVVHDSESSAARLVHLAEQLAGVGSFGDRSAGQSADLGGEQGICAADQIASLDDGDKHGAIDDQQRVHVIIEEECSSICH